MRSIKERKKKEQERLKDSVRALYRGIWRDKNAAQEQEYSSEANALYDILEYYKLDKIRIPPTLKEESGLSYILRESGMLMRRITLEGEWWKYGGLPLLVTDEDGEEFALLPDRSGRYARVYSGALKRIHAKEAERIKAEAYCFYQSLPAEQSGFGALIRFWMQSIRPSDVWMIVFVSVLVELCGLLLPYINSVVYNSIIPSGTAREIPGIMILVLSSVFFSALIGLSRNISISRIGQKMQVVGQSAVWSRMFSLPTAFFKRYEAGELYNRANSVTQICQIIGGQMIPAVLSALLSFVYLVQISWFAGSLVAPSIIILVVMFLNIMTAGVMQVKQNRRKTQVENRVTSILYQLVGGIMKIRTSGAEVRAFQKWAEEWKDMPVLSRFFLQVTDVFAAVIPIAGSIWLYITAWNSGLSASDFIAFSTAFGSLQAAILALSAVGFQFGELKIYVDMLQPILDEQPEICGGKEYVSKISGSIEISNLFFRYTPQMPYVIDGLTLQVKKGEYIGIVGGSGCGKSTLFRLLLGFEVPESGSVYYDGKDVNRMELKSLRQRIGVVLQNGSLFSGDIYTNLSICAPWLTMDEAWEAVEKAGLAEDIEKMPMGMFTMLSEDGGGISGGQKQRLLIARALASRPDILLFDEATSALDNKTQAIVVNSLKELSCTRLVIAHRLSTIRDCDRILYLDKGKIVEEGTYEQLMARNGAFAKMAERQMVSVNGDAG